MGKCSNAWSWTMAAMAFAAFILFVQPAAADEPWGWELPDLGEPVRIIALYQSDQGDLVAYFVNKRKLRDYGPSHFSGLFDLKTREQLTTPDEMASIKNHETEMAVLNKHHLNKVYFFGGPSDPSVLAKIEDFSGPRCALPYDEGFSINGKLYLIVWKPPAPIRQAYGCSSTEGEGPSGTVRTRYQGQEYAFNYKVGSNWYFIMQDAPWVIRFDAQGETHFFDHRQDAALVPAEPIQGLVQQMQWAKKAEVRRLSGEVEAIIDAHLNRAR